MSDWFYSQNGQQLGPVTDADLKSLISQGSIKPDDLVWREGMSQWIVIRDLKEFEPYLPQVTSPVASNLPYQSMGGYYPQGQAVPPPPNYLVQAILVTVCCCWPFGIPAIVFAAQVNGLYHQGQYQLAMEKSKSAKTWTLVSFICGLVIGLIYLAAGILSGFKT